MVRFIVGLDYVALSSSSDALILIILCAAFYALCCIVSHRHVFPSSTRNGPNPMPDGSVPQQCCFLDDMIKRKAFTMNLSANPKPIGIKVPAVFIGVNDGKHILAAARAKYVLSWCLLQRVI